MPKVAKLPTGTDANAVLAERQRLINTAIRFARGNYYCDIFTRVLTNLVPEFMHPETGRFYAADGQDAYNNHLPATQGRYNTRGWDDAGYDRDGLTKWGINREGYDKDGYTVSYDKDGFARNGVNRDGYDRNGVRVVGRPATPEEALAESEEPFNPITAVLSLDGTKLVTVAARAREEAEANRAAVQAELDKVAEAPVPVEEVPAKTPVKRAPRKATATKVTRLDNDGNPTGDPLAVNMTVAEFDAQYGGLAERLAAMRAHGPLPSEIVF